MKVIRYKMGLSVPRQTFNGYNIWMDKFVKSIKRQTIPNIPIYRVFKMKVEYTLHTQVAMRPSGEMLSSIQTALHKAGVIRTPDHWSIARCDMVTHYVSEEPEVMITLWVNEKDPRNVGVCFDDMKCLIRMFESDSFVVKQMSPLSRSLFVAPSVG